MLLQSRAASDLFWQTILNSKECLLKVFELAFMQKLSLPIKNVPLGSSPIFALIILMSHNFTTKLYYAVHISKQASWWVMIVVVTLLLITGHKYCGIKLQIKSWNLSPIFRSINMLRPQFIISMKLYCMPAWILGTCAFKWYSISEGTQVAKHHMCP